MENTNIVDIGDAKAKPNKTDKKVEKNKPKTAPSKIVNKTTKPKAVRTYTREVFDTDTGELENQTVIETQEDTDFNWQKTWITNLFLALKVLGSKRVECAMWLLENKNSDNQIVYTQREIAELTGISIKTVNETMKLLVSCDAIRRKNGKGIAMWNPDIVAKGNSNRRHKLVIDFGKLPSAVPEK